jgi:hypothetical protein
MFVNYLRVIRKYGDKARKLSKSMLYEEAGEPFGYDHFVAGRIIRKSLRMPESELRAFLLQQEADDMLDLVLKLRG